MHNLWMTYFRLPFSCDGNASVSLFFKHSWVCVVMFCSCFTRLFLIPSIRRNRLFFFPVRDSLVLDTLPASGSLSVLWIIDGILPASLHHHPLCVFLCPNFPFLEGRRPVILDYSPPSWPHLNLITSVKMLFSNEVTFWHILGVRKPASLWERRHSATHITSLRVKTTNKVKREPGKEMGGLQASVRDPFPGLQIVKALGLCPPASPGQPQHGACSTSHGRGLSRATNGDKEAQQRSRGTPERMAAAFLWLHPLFLRWLVIMCPLQLKNLNKTVTCL